MKAGSQQGGTENGLMARAPGGALVGKHIASPEETAQNNRELEKLLERLPAEERRELLDPDYGFPDTVDTEMNS
jgi:hypothetical protein